MEKICVRCKQEKPISCFHKRATSKDGRVGHCKECAAAYDAKRARDPARIASMKNYQLTNNGLAANNKAKSEYKNRYPTKKKAHAKVSSAIRSGKLIRQPCEIEHCGIPKTYAHHDDYAKPLVVRWLCSVHHAEWHKINGEALNPG